jgi:hypothetical protein
VNIPPESSDQIRKRAAEHHRLTRRARMEAMEADMRSLKALGDDIDREFGRRMKDFKVTLGLLQGRLGTLRSEVEIADAPTDRIERPGIRDMLEPL